MPSRRTTIKGIGAAGGLAAFSGTVAATDEHDSDDDGTGDGNETDGDQPERIEPPESGLRVAHFSPDAPNVDVYLDDDLVLEDVAYGTVSEYLPVDPGTYGVRITAAGDEETVVFDEDVTVEEETIYSAFAVGLLEPPEGLEDREFEVNLTVDRGVALPETESDD